MGGQGGPGSQWEGLGVMGKLGETVGSLGMVGSFWG